MSEIKWIKITTGMFQDEKIDYIESLPEADAILIIWIKLLTLAGKCNSNGFIFLTENIPYTYQQGSCFLIQCRKHHGKTQQQAPNSQCR